MKKFHEYEDDDQDSFHDVIVELGLDSAKSEEFYNLLPRHIQFTAYEWGLSDTVFRDNAYEWLKERYEL